MKLGRMTEKLPNWKNAVLAVVSALLLVLAFPDFEFWWLAWVALVPLLWAIERERESTARGFVLGWLFGTIFFFGTCWWLTFAPITYAAFPPALAYFLMLLVSIAAGIFPAIFGGVMAFLLRRFGSIALLVAPFVWVFSEFLRYWLTGNNWNAIGYSQAFMFFMPGLAQLGGVLFLSFTCVAFGSALLYASKRRTWLAVTLALGILPLVFVLSTAIGIISWGHIDGYEKTATVIALQPNVPMSGLTESKWHELRQRHLRLAEAAIADLKNRPKDKLLGTPITFDPTPVNDYPITIIFPESPMNFMYETDAESKAFIDSFAAKHNVNVLFNSAEPDAATGKFFNSAVMVGPEGREIQQYDKIYLVPFGEAVPFPLEGILPGFVGNFAYGSEHSLFPLGDARAGAMICFESHFGQLSRQYVLNGADVLIEMTNDGYLGPTPVLRQHLANAVFRSVETNRPLLRVTNVGITAYITERGEVENAAPVYQEGTRIWTVSKSDGSQTFYVKYGDWFAWLCSIISVGLLIFGFLVKRRPSLDAEH